MFRVILEEAFAWTGINTIGLQDELRFTKHHACCQSASSTERKCTHRQVAVYLWRESIVRLKQHTSYLDLFWVTNTGYLKVSN